MMEQHLQSKKHQQLANHAVGSKESTKASQEVGSHTPVVNPAEANTTILPPPAPPATGPTTCIFCNRSFNDVEVAVRHMLRRHGFFIPDAEYLVDLSGLLTYCNEKVKLGGMCLYCNGRGKQFDSYVDVQRHMEDKSHCKLLYEPGEDKEEFALFYDFTTSYPDAIREEEEIMEEGVSDDDDDDDEEVTYVSELGELVLSDGRTLGSRQLRRYYRQRYRLDDTREAVLAIKSEVQDRALSAVGGRKDGGTLVLGERHGRLDPKTFRMNVRALKAAGRHQERVNLKTEMNANKFHKRPQVDG